MWFHGLQKFGKGTILQDQRVERRLAAVLAADVAGYSRLMGADEVGTLEALKAHRRDIVDPAIAEFRGRIVKTTGDGILVEFASAVDAVTCAMKVQGQMAEHAVAPTITFRIGINIGDIIIDGGDIFGDGVNVAARVENECPPGGVCVSEDVVRQVRGRTTFSFEDLGERALKNIDRPVRVFAVHSANAESVPINGPRPIGSSIGAALALPDKPSIAVLPFQNMSGDPEQEYFADGMVEDIITALSRFKSLFVIARNSSFTYKGRAVDIKQVGRDLGVRYVLEGSVRKAGQKVRITGQLIEAATGAHLWADKFDGELNDIFELQDEITTRVVTAIFPKLQQSEIDRVKRKPTENLTAYDYYLRALAPLLSIYRKETFEQARPLLHKAIELDPEFASAYAVTSFWYGVSLTFGWSKDRGKDTQLSIELARKALELDSEDAAVLTYAGYMLAYAAHQPEEAAEFLMRATKANPNLALGWLYRGWVNVNLGHYAEAEQYFRMALRLNPIDPLAFVTHLGIAYSQFFKGQREEALNSAEKAFHMNPDFLGTIRFLMVCYAHLGFLDKARATWDVSRTIDPTQRVSNARQRFLMRNEGDFQLLMEGFRLAGMPE
jgi:TolB-like protein/class 3 adenylate cyclase/Tfp pilus assembly protein PilF